MRREGGDDDWVKSLKMLEGGGELSTAEARKGSKGYPVLPPSVLPDISSSRARLSHMRACGCVEPLPLVGRGWGGVFAPH